jgi:predicted protein tyrosine phosphatase
MSKDNDNPPPGHLAKPPRKRPTLSAECKSDKLLVVKILFVCSQNKWRSLTAERIYDGFPGYSVRSAGTEEGARIKLTAGHIGWADLIFCMETKHMDRIRQNFSATLLGKQLICLHVPDDYDYLEAELIELLKSKLSAYIEVPE